MLNELISSLLNKRKSKTRKRLSWLQMCKLRCTSVTRLTRSSDRQATQSQTARVESAPCRLQVVHRMPHLWPLRLISKQHLRLKERRKQQILSNSDHLQEREGGNLMTKRAGRTSITTRLVTHLGRRIKSKVSVSLVNNCHRILLITVLCPLIVTNLQQKVTGKLNFSNS